jgi:hypothetical protein
MGRSRREGKYSCKVISIDAAFVARLSRGLLNWTKTSWRSAHPSKLPRCARCTPRREETEVVPGVALGGSNKGQGKLSLRRECCGVSQTPIA